MNMYLVQGGVNVMALREIADGLITSQTIDEPVKTEESIDDELAAALAEEVAIASGAK